MKRKPKYFFYSFLILIILFIGFIAWDNYRIKVTQEDVSINNLPEALEGFKILQITDLHEEEFGKNQRRLLKAINSVDYDVLVFTGDMLDNTESTNYEPFYTILEGIEHNENTFFVPGNADAPSYQMDPEFGKSEFVKGIEERGATFLESIATIEKNGTNIHFSNLELSIIKNPDQIGKVNGSFQEPLASEEQYNTYQKKLWMEMVNGEAFHSSNPHIALNHYPIPDARFDYIKTDANTILPNYDLIIAGHYHGGQIRFPFFGALFIPDPWYEPNSFFPPKDRVKGLWEYQGTQQYVSAGLGTSDAIPFLKLRLFNPSEINVITLTSSND